MAGLPPVVNYWGFFELINQSPDEAVAYEFTSREVKQLAFRLDGLFLPTTNEPEKPLYLVEVQFQPDPDLYYRKLLVINKRVASLLIANC
ncbi:hypothetical protein MiSe_90500 [Microseira wollei NIES-4236]|uniref:Uncharacterized protein n=1 Tax=Microseira wollei NIES-4236 TaxID=2530354 RepID=A0AAV3XNW8_9CYAN|nr:hypothetical protein MiSe_90500 [Microseira wollei NIES-4236]